jgi:predicted ATPase
MSALDYIAVRGYKSIRDLELTLRPLNLLIGANGAGKSNLISVFELLSQVAQGHLQRFVGQAGGADALLYFGRERTEAIDIKFCFFIDESQDDVSGAADLRNLYHCQLLPTADDALIFGQETASFHHTKKHDYPMDTYLGAGHSETKLTDAQYGIPKYVYRAMRSWRVFHFHDTSESARIKGSGDLHDNRELRDDAANLAAFLYYLRERHAARYDKIVQTVRLAAPFFEDFVLAPSQLNPEKIRLEWREKGTDTYFNAHALSDGTLRFICLTTLLQMPEPPATIIIDEPELGLHPYAITLLAAMLRSAATRTQVIVSTQSVTLVNQFGPKDIVVVDRQDQQSIFTRPDPQALKTWLEEYSLGDLWEKNLLGGRPR